MPAATLFCSCPEPLPPDQDANGRLARCSACGRLRKPPPAETDRRVARWVIGGILGLVAPLLLTFVVYRLVTHRFTTVLEEYRGRKPLPVSPAQDDLQVRTVIKALFFAIQERRGGSFSQCFSIPRTLAEIESKGAGMQFHYKRQEDDLQEELNLSLGGLCGEFEEKRWKGLVRETLRFDAAKGEAEATCLVKLKEPRLYAHLRFWLIKEERGWGIYDFEDLDNRNRLSSTVGGAAKSADPIALSLRVSEVQTLFKKSLELRNSGDTKEALDHIRKAGDAARGTVLEAVTAVVEAGLLVDLERREEAIQVFDRLLQARKGLPNALVGKGVLLDQMGRKAEALALFEEAAAVLGDDPGLLINIGRLKDHLGKPADAKPAYLRACSLVHEDPDLAIDLGYLLLRRGAAKEAGPILVAAGVEGEDHFIRAASLLKEARAASEMEDLLRSNKADVLAPGEIPLFHGALLRWKGRLDESERVLRAALVVSPPENSLFFMEELSLTLSDLKKKDEALKLASQVATAEGWAANGRFLKACAVAAGSPEIALAEVRAALKQKSSLVVAVDHETLLAPIRSTPEFKRLLDELRPRVELGR